jgi:hypothetical protein
MTSGATSRVTSRAMCRGTRTRDGGDVDEEGEHVDQKEY